MSMGCALSESQGLCRFLRNLITKPEKVLAYSIIPPDALMFRTRGRAQYFNIAAPQRDFRGFSPLGCAHSGRIHGAIGNQSGPAIGHLSPEPRGFGGGRRE